MEAVQGASKGCKATFSVKMCFPFLTCLHVAIINSPYWNILLKPKQVIALGNIFNGKDVLGVLPSGYAKSLIFHLLPVLLFCKSLKGQGFELIQSNLRVIPTIVIVISPLNSLMVDQIRRLINYKNFGFGDIRLTASVLNVKFSQDYITCDMDNNMCQKQKSGHYNLLFSHPEAFISCKYGRDLMLGKVYQKNICAVVVDEAHCILEWYVRMFISLNRVNCEPMKGEKKTSG